MCIHLVCRIHHQLVHNTILEFSVFLLIENGCEIDPLSVGFRAPGYQNGSESHNIL